MRRQSKDLALLSTSFLRIAPLFVKLERDDALTLLPPSSLLPEERDSGSFSPSHSSSKSDTHNMGFSEHLPFHPLLASYAYEAFLSGNDCSRIERTLSTHFETTSALLKTLREAVNRRVNVAKDLYTVIREEKKRMLRTAVSQASQESAVAALTSGWKGVTSKSDPVNSNNVELPESSDKLKQKKNTASMG